MLGSTGHHVRFRSPANFQNPDCPETGRRTFNTFKKRTIFFFFFFFFQIFFFNFLFSIFFLFIFKYIPIENFWHQICVHGPYHMRIDNLYLLGKMYKNISPDSVRSGRTCPANLGSGLVRKLICPVRLSPKRMLLSQIICSKERTILR